MGTRLREIDIGETLAAQLQRRPGDAFRLYWLGQAGFVLDHAGKRIFIDPYLSDSLAEKYRGTIRPHERMMAAPVSPDECQHVDLVLCTHAHTDHMDPGTLKPLLAQNPHARLIAPRAMREQVVLRSGMDDQRLLLTDAGDTVRPFDGLSITVTRAAHEAIETDERGHHRFLGYGIDTGVARVWHSGDCIPFNGIEAEVAAFGPYICLLPVNGRRPELSENGVPGNFTLAEAIDLAHTLGASNMIAHHYGMFEFNTESPEVIDAVAFAEKRVHVVRAKIGVCYELDGRKSADNRIPPPLLP